MQSMICGYCTRPLIRGVRIRVHPPLLRGYLKSRNHCLFYRHHEMMSCNASYCVKNTRNPSRIPAFFALYLSVACEKILLFLCFQKRPTSIFDYSTLFSGFQLYRVYISKSNLHQKISFCDQRTESPEKKCYDKPIRARNRRSVLWQRNWRRFLKKSVWPAGAA